MDQSVSFIYCSILLIVYSAALSFACCLYLICRQRIFLPLMGLFSLYLLDNLIIFMAEQLPVFSRWYNQTFLASPSIKSVIFLGLGFFTLYAWNVVTGHKFSPLQGFTLILLGLWLFFIPLMERGSLEVWLYFLGYQLFSIITSAYALWKLRQLDARDCTVPPRAVKLLLICIMILSLSIVGEDTFVIFTVDNYDVRYLDIFNRSISEDVLRVIFIVFFFALFGRQLCRSAAAAQSPSGPSSEDADLREEPAAEGGADATLDYKRLKFSRGLGFTERETEVFFLMLDDLNYQQISATLHISPGTVKAHAHNIFQKAGVAHRHELLRRFECFSADPPS